MPAASYLIINIIRDILD